jgi:hypothetical protein
MVPKIADFAWKIKSVFFIPQPQSLRESTEHPQNENYAGNVVPYCKRSCYDEGKRYAEALIFQYGMKRV